MPKDKVSIHHQSEDQLKNKIIDKMKEILMHKIYPHVFDAFFELFKKKQPLFLQKILKEKEISENINEMVRI